MQFDRPPGARTFSPIVLRFSGHLHPATGRLGGEARSKGTGQQTARSSSLLSLDRRGSSLHQSVWSSDRLTVARIPSTRPVQAREQLLIPAWQIPHSRSLILWTPNEFWDLEWGICQAAFDNPRGGSTRQSSCTVERYSGTSEAGVGRGDGSLGRYESQVRAELISPTSRESPGRSRSCLLGHP